MSAEQDLIEAFQTSEIRHARRLDGTVANAEQALLRIRARLQELAAAADVQEFQCPTRTDWDLLVLHALLKRYGLQAYRYRKQRKSTILVRVSKRFMNDCLWPIFNDAVGQLAGHVRMLTLALTEVMAPGPFSVTVRNSSHELCDDCMQRLGAESGAAANAEQWR